MSRDLGRDVPDLEKLYARKLWADFLHPTIVPHLSMKAKGVLGPKLSAKAGSVLSCNANGCQKWPILVTVCDFSNCTEGVLREYCSVVFAVLLCLSPGPREKKRHAIHVQLGPEQNHR